MDIGQGLVAFGLIPSNFRESTGMLCGEGYGLLLHLRSRQVPDGRYGQRGIHATTHSSARPDKITVGVISNKECKRQNNTQVGVLLRHPLSLISREWPPDRF